MRNREDQPLIVLGAFGTTIPEARKRCLEPFDADVASAFPNAERQWAYTSAIVRRKMAEAEGVIVPDLESVLFEVDRDRCVVVLPLLVLAGREYDAKILSVTRRYPTVQVTKPLLAAGENIPVVGEILADPVDPGDVVVYIGHGTDHGAATRYGELQDWLDTRGPNWIVATIEHGEGVESVLRTLSQREVNRVVLRPLLLTAGEHVRSDIAGPDEESWLTRIAGEGYTVDFEDVPLAVIPEVRQLFVHQCAEFVGTGARV